MPFVVPASTRGKKKELPLYEVLLNRLGDFLAGKGLENIRIENDLKQEAEEMMTTTTSSVSSVQHAATNASSNSNSTTIDIDATAAASSSSSSSLGISGVQEREGEDGEETIFINKYGAHFVYIPSLGRYIARADRKTVRASTISGRLCFLFQIFIIAVGHWCIFARSVSCMSADENSETHQRPVKTVYPGWEVITQQRSAFYMLVYFSMLIAVNWLQVYLLASGDRSAGNPGFLSIEGDEVAFEIGGAFQNCTIDPPVSLPTDLRRSCKTCGGPQPLRSRHCRNCGRCVARCDHHCLFLGGRCVGAFDYGGFVLVIFFMALCGAIGLGFLFDSWLDIYTVCLNPSSPDAGWFRREWHANGSLLFVIFLVLVGDIILWILFLTHVSLTLTDMTTYEFARPGKNIHMRYYSITPDLSAASTKGIGVLASPYSERNLKNFYNLWWVYGMKSLRRRFKIFQFVDNNTLPAVRNGSVDGINYFVGSKDGPAAAAAAAKSSSSSSSSSSSAESTVTISSSSSSSNSVTAAASSSSPSSEKDNQRLVEGKANV